MVKTENWGGHSIRFIEKNGEWWAVLKDVCDALGLKAKRVSERLCNEAVSNDLISDSTNRRQKMLIVNEYGIYDTVFQSRKPEARSFRYWVYGILKELRAANGFEGFEVFRMLDKEHQKEMVRSLRAGLANPTKTDYIKANAITNKAISTKYGYSKMVKKGEMPPNALRERQKVLQDTVDLMQAKERFGLDISISEKIYSMVGGKPCQK